MSTRSHWKRKALGVSFLALAAVWGAPAASAESADTLWQTAQSNAVADYDIPAQPLATAMAAFGRQSGLQLVADEALLGDLQSYPVNGQMTAEAALSELLTGTGLTYRIVDQKTIALELAAESFENGTLAPVTVTAERAERSIMDTATSVVVLDQETIEQRPGVQSNNDLLESIPNVVSAGTGNFAPAVRGLDGTGPAQGADAFLAGTRPRLNVAVDGRPLSYNEVVFGDVSLWDVQQVEVLRGAQSTLQGRNAIAGTVAIKTNDPTYDYEFGGRFIGGNYDGRVYSGMASGPIVDDQLAFRVAMDYQTHETYVDGFENIPNDDDPDDFRSMNVRAKLLIEPEDWEGFSTLLTIQHAAYQGPQTESVSHPKSDRDAAFPFMPLFNPKSTGGTADTTWEINDNWTLEGTLSITDVDIERKAQPGDGNAHINALEIVGEPRVRFTGLDGDLTVLTGFYVFNSRQDEVIDLLGGGTFDDKTDTYAVFTEGTWTFLDDFDLTLGARYERERRRRTGAMNIFEIDLDKTYDAFLPKVGVAWHPTDEFTLGATVSRGYNGGGAGFTFEPPFESYTFKPEYVWTYEAYTRADLLDNTLQLTGNVFYSKYKDIQLPFDLNPDPNVWSQVIRNADRAETYGAEMGARWQATPELQFFADVGVLQTKITKYSGSELEGNELALSPDVTANIGLVYRHESGFDFSADARFTDNYFSSVENSGDEETDPYVLLNLQTGYSLGNEDANLRVFGFVTNVFDSSAETLIERGATNADDSISIVQPRTFGIGIQAKF